MLFGLFRHFWHARTQPFSTCPTTAAAGRRNPGKDRRAGLQWGVVVTMHLLFPMPVWCVWYSPYHYHHTTIQPQALSSFSVGGGFRKAGLVEEPHPSYLFSL